MGDSHFKIHKGTTHAPQASEPSNPTDGDVYYDSTLNKFRAYQNGAWTDLIGGSGGAGGINYIENSNAEANSTLGWATYADAADDQPTDGTGGSASVTFTSQNSTVLREQYSFQLSKGASDLQGEGASYDYTIDSADKNEPLRISFEYEASANFDFGDFTDPVSDPSDVVVYIYDKDSATLIQPSTFTLDGSGKFSTQYYPVDNTSRDYRIIFHVATTNASAWDLVIDSVQVGPVARVSGVPVSDWVEFTPTGNWTTNTTYVGRYRRVGDTMEIEGHAKLSGAPNSAQFSLDVPLGLSIDTDKLSDNTVNEEQPHLGTARAFDSSPTGTYLGGVTFQSPTSVRVTDNSGADLWTQAVPITFANADAVNFNFKIPIVGWSSNVQFSEDADTRVVALDASTNAANSISDTTFTFIDFEDINNDTHGAVLGAGSGNVTTSGTGWRYEVPVSGFYHVASSIRLTGSTDFNGTTETVQIAIRKNNTQQGNKDIIPPSSTGSLSVSIDKTFIADRGDIIEIVVFQNSGNSRSMASSGNSNYVSIHKVSGPATIAASEKIRAKYRTSTAQAVNDGDTINYSTRDFDSHNAVTTGASWVFTAPRSAFCTISANNSTGTVAAGGTNQVFRLRVEVNGSLVDQGSGQTAQSTSTIRYAAQVTTLLLLEQGDEVNIAFGENIPAVNLDGSAANNWIAIECN